MHWSNHIFNMELSLGEMLDHLICTKTSYITETETIYRAHYNSHTEPLFKNPNIRKVADMYEYQVVLFMHDYKKATYFIQ